MSAVADAMADAAGELLASLSPDQRQLAAWPFPSDDERQRWFYTPTDHGGLTLHQMDDPQQRLVMRLLASGLSRPGYVTAATIMGLENVLDELEGWRATFDRPRGRDPSMYYVRVFGRPEPGGTWAWRFGGHHVSINHLVVDGEVAASTPCFFGADPASSPLLGPNRTRRHRDFVGAAGGVGEEVGQIGPRCVVAVPDHVHQPAWPRVWLMPSRTTWAPTPTSSCTRSQGQRVKSSPAAGW